MNDVVGTVDLLVAQFVAAEDKASNAEWADRFLDIQERHFPTSTPATEESHTRRTCRIKVYNAIAMVHLVQGNWAGVRTWCLRVLHLEDENAEALYRLGVFFRHTGSFDTASRVLFFVCQICGDDQQVVGVSGQYEYMKSAFIESFSGDFEPEQTDSEGTDELLDSDEETESRADMPYKPASMSNVHIRSNVSHMPKNLNQCLSSRERFGGWQRKLSQRLGCRFLPVHHKGNVLPLPSRRFEGHFSSDGSLFYSTSQGASILLYDTSNVRDISLLRQLPALEMRWTVTDTDVSSDQEYLVYSSINPVLHMANLRHADDVQERFSLVSADGDPFGVFACAFSTPQGNEVVAGCSDGYLRVLDVETKKVLTSVSAHDSDVNAVNVHPCSPNLVVSGSDDATCVIWDRRVMGSGGRQVGRAGTFVGHFQGITDVRPKGDGIHYVSNSKDQTIKTWDIRKAHQTSKKVRIRFPHWDYRYGREYPLSRKHFNTKQEHDCSLQTFRGHSVLSTLIRCYYTPERTTGGRYVASGSADGHIYMFDTLTGKLAHRLPKMHTDVIRDISFHPWEPVMISTSWDGTLGVWGVRDDDVFD